MSVPAGSRGSQPRPKTHQLAVNLLAARSRLAEIRINRLTEGVFTPWRSERSVKVDASPSDAPVLERMAALSGFVRRKRRNGYSPITFGDLQRVISTLDVTLAAGVRLRSSLACFQRYTLPGPGR